MQRQRCAGKWSRIADRLSLLSGDTMETEQNDTQPEEDELTNSVKSTKTVKIRVADIDWLRENAVDDETPAATLSRILEHYNQIVSEPTLDDANKTPEVSVPTKTVRLQVADIDWINKHKINDGETPAVVVNRVVSDYEKLSHAIKVIRISMEDVI